MVYFAFQLNELKVVLIKPTFVRLGCGKTGIRTLGTRKSTTVFETVPFDRSGIFPFWSNQAAKVAVISVLLGKVREFF